MANAPTPTTNVPQCTLTPTGFQAPQESAILAGTVADIDQAVGGGLNPSLTTPQGQLASSMAAIIGFCYDFFLYYTNQVDPTYAQGRMQDAIARIYFIERMAGLEGYEIDAAGTARMTTGLGRYLPC